MAVQGSRSPGSRATVPPDTLDGPAPWNESAFGDRLGQTATNHGLYELWVQMKVRTAFLCGVVFALTLRDNAAWAELALKIDVVRHKPCNLFAVDQPVRFAGAVRCNQAGSGSLAVEAVDFYGRTGAAKEVPFEVEANRTAPVEIDLGSLAPGYYELRAKAMIGGRGDESANATGTMSFGVVRTVHRTAEEARRGPSRFGMKLWLVGDIWWNRSLKWDPGEVTEACAAVGLQWTRALISQQSLMDTRELMRAYPMNVISKIECFPAECFDDQRYGPWQEFRSTQEGRAWDKCTLPKEQPYKAWLREQIRTIPADQNVFEVWNEPWQWFRTMPAEDFATVCRWTAQVVRAERPDAVVGPNIHGDLTSYDLAVIAAGGLDEANMVAIHPYAAGTPESKGFRQRIRNYHDLLKRKLGRDLDLYATEFGWSTAPQGDRCVDEAEQARRTVRESLMLYAEGVQALIPHTMGQREQNPKEREDWFGFFRLRQEPTPALVAFANCARMIDASRFVGDLWFGPGVGAMLFERASVYTLALWTEGDAKQVAVDVAVDAVTSVDLMGRQQQLTASGGRLTLDVGGDVVYLVGVGSRLAQAAADPSQPLRPDRWHTRVGSHTMPRLTTPPTIDGRLADWQQVPASSLAATNLDDLAAEWRLGWDERCLYLAVRVQDKKILNDNPVERIDLADVVDFQICPRPDRQVSEPSLYDYRLLVAPTSADGKPVCVFENVLTGKAVVPAHSDTGAVRWAVGQEEEPQDKNAKKHWNVEAAIPWAQLNGAVAEAGRKMSFLLVVFDRDRTDVDEWRQWHKRLETCSKKRPASQRPYLFLGE
jgi:hypothetical protein